MTGHATTTSAAEQPYFVCPACGRSFNVRSWYSTRIFCGSICKRAADRMASDG